MLWPCKNVFHYLSIEWTIVMLMHMLIYKAYEPIFFLLSNNNNTSVCVHVASFKFCSLPQLQQASSSMNECNAFHTGAGSNFPFAISKTKNKWWWFNLCNCRTVRSRWFSIYTYTYTYIDAVVVRVPNGLRIWTVRRQHTRMIYSFGHIYEYTI